jgi:cytidyltransferase-like protein
MSPEKRKCLVPGSYDPITNGHLDIIARASPLIDERRYGDTLIRIHQP